MKLKQGPYKPNQPSGSVFVRFTHGHIIPFPIHCKIKVRVQSSVPVLCFQWSNLVKPFLETTKVPYRYHLWSANLKICATSASDAEIILLTKKQKGGWSKYQVLKSKFIFNSSLRKFVSLFDNK